MARPLALQPLNRRIAWPGPLHYALSNYNEREAANIKDKLEGIIEALYPKFISIYSSCYNKHPNIDIEQEIQFMKLLVNDTSALESSFDNIKMLIMPFHDNKSYDGSEFAIDNLLIEDDPMELSSKGILTGKAFSESNLLIFDCINSMDAVEINKVVRSFSIQSEILVEQGVILNSLLLYKKAIEVLSQAIKLNSSNREAYLERAIAYFETNQIKLALKDYEKAKQFAPPPFKSEVDLVLRGMYIPKYKAEFSKGLIKGVLRGAHESAEEIIPAIFSCFHGILHGLWAFASSPSDMSQEIIDTAYAIGEYITTHDAIECLECVVPELKDLSFTWHQVDDYSKGKKIGYMIGKYGVEIFAPIGLIKGISKFKSLKRANAGLTFARCSESYTAQKKIIEKSLEFAAKRESIFQEAAKTGSLLIKTENVVYHVMQEHHHWEKVVELSGNIKKDFNKILNFIESNKIIHNDNIKRTLKHKSQPITVDIYSKNINGHEVYLYMENYLERGETFLKNAYVGTNK